MGVAAVVVAVMFGPGLVHDDGNDGAPPVTNHPTPTGETAIDRGVPPKVWVAAAEDGSPPSVSWLEGGTMHFPDGGTAHLVEAQAQVRGTVNVALSYPDSFGILKPGGGFRQLGAYSSDADGSTLMKVSPDGAEVAVQSGGRQVQVFDVNTGLQVASHRPDGPQWTLSAWVGAEVIYDNGAVHRAWNPSTDAVRDLPGEQPYALDLLLGPQLLPGVGLDCYRVVQPDSDSNGTPLSGCVRAVSTSCRRRGTTSSTCAAGGRRTWGRASSCAPPAPARGGRAGDRGGGQASCAALPQRCVVDVRCLGGRRASPGRGAHRHPQEWALDDVDRSVHGVDRRV